MMKENIPLQPNEEVKPIQGYEGLYSITSFGRVWSHNRIRKFGKQQRRIKAKFLKLALDKSVGYFLITLSKEGKLRTFRVHRLVALHYIPNPQNLPMVNHKDTNKQNCKESNLEWCTRDENEKHAMINNLKIKSLSKYFGVSYFSNSRSKNKWRAGVTKDGKYDYLGSFGTELEAAQTYNEYITKYDLNKPLNEMPVIYNFPAITLKVSKRSQIEKIQEEFIEFLTAKNQHEEYEEWADFLNCIETYMRTQMSEKKLTRAKKFVIEKNWKRGYYKSKDLDKKS